MKTVSLGTTVLLLIAACCLAAAEPVLLVAMHDTGCIEAYEVATGKWLGTLTEGLESPNALCAGPEGALYVACGVSNGPGVVVKVDGKTGEVLEESISYPDGDPAQPRRATDVKVLGEALYIASCDDGRLLRYALSDGAFLGEVAKGSAGGVTELELHDGRLYWADFQTHSVRRSSLEDSQVESFTTRSGFAPWGLAFGSDENLFWSGSDHTIQRCKEGTNTTWVGPEAGLTTPIHLELVAERLFVSDYSGGTITIWSAQEPYKLLLTIKGDEVKGPMGMAFSEEAPNKGKPKLVGLEAGSGGNPVVRLEARADKARVDFLGWDTEGGDRARVNLLRRPAQLRLLLDSRWKSSQNLPATLTHSEKDALEYRLDLGEGTLLIWRLRLFEGGLDIRLKLEGVKSERLQGVQLELPLNPRNSCATVLNDKWSEDGKALLPCVLSAPDLGQMRLSCNRYPDLPVGVEGSRLAGKLTLTFDLPVPDQRGYALSFRPVLLPRPAGYANEARWKAARRGWFNFLEATAHRPAEGNHTETTPGLWANNTLSDPVSSTIFWLGEAVLLVPELAEGVTSTALLRRTLDAWLTNRVNEEGQVTYVWTGGYGMMDAPPALLIAAWSYVEATGDLAWYKANYKVLNRIADYVAGRDVDGDGLVESKQTGNSGTYLFGDTAWDTYSSGHKNAYVNALAYRAFLCLVDLESRLGNQNQADLWRSRATKLKAAFRDCFYNPDSGWLGWWRSEDGVLHDINSDVPTDLAILYGLIEEAEGAQMLDKYWKALQQSGFERFDLGVPLNIRPVPRDDQYQGWGGQNPDGSDTFGKYLNGGCCVSNAGLFLAANWVAGHTDRANMVQDAMLKRQVDGFFPNGGGFQNGFVDRYPEGAEFYDWEGNTCGYEGHLVYSWIFLQAMLMEEPALRQRVFGPVLSD